ncbi:hypothetical protein MTBLM1_120055 [Rhodospirillaceae bacterium LM-1]|nr:hypothetical protein MTBLM1_120055 [Rhodospirillaceae bacterium LM-1]
MLKPGDESDFEFTIIEGHGVYADEARSKRADYTFVIGAWPRQSEEEAFSKEEMAFDHYVLEKCSEEQRKRGLSGAIVECRNRYLQSSAGQEINTKRAAFVAKVTADRARTIPISQIP